METFSPQITELLQVIQDLSLTTTMEEVVELTRRATRKLSGAEGATFVLKDGDNCFYVDEDAIEPLWKGKRFPLETCISGWSMINRQSVAIEDIYQDDRIPIDAYRPTFVKSLLMVPIRPQKPIGAIGIYWAKRHQPTADEVRLLEALAQSTSIAIENVQHIAKLEAACRSKDELLSIVSHELRTPLSAIKLQLQLVDKVLTEKKLIKEKGLELSLTQIENMSSLVEQLEEASRILLHDLHLKKKELSLSPLIQRSYSLWKPRLDQSSSQVILDLEDGVKGNWDEHSLDRVMNHLFSNAIKHAPGGQITVRSRKEGPQVFITFQDNGPGIPREIRSQLFHLFERGKAPRYVRGFGLGLYITKNLVEANGGRISIEESSDKGTTFLIALPTA